MEQRIRYALEAARMVEAMMQMNENPAGERALESSEVQGEDQDEEQDENNVEYQFQRESRKPMRLRWGRSTGKAPAEQKVSKV